MTTEPTPEPTHPTMPQPFSAEEILALREWHQRRASGKACLQGDPWPCRTSRFLATLDAQSNPAQVARFYSEWNQRIEAEQAALRESVR